MIYITWDCSAQERTRTFIGTVTFLTSILICIVGNEFTCKQMGWPSQRYGKLTNHFMRVLVVPLVLQQEHCQIDIHTKRILCTTETTQNVHLQFLFLICMGTSASLSKHDICGQTVVAPMCGMVMFSTVRGILCLILTMLQI